MLNDKTIKLTLKKLESPKEEEVLFTIKQIRNTGDAKLLPALIDLLNTSGSNKVKLAITDLLYDIKDENAPGEIVKALKKTKYKKIHKALLTACWQSGMDYSGHLNLFVGMFISGNFEVAFEAFTIIDNFEEKYDAEIIDANVESLKSKISEFKGADKEGLFVELIHVLEKLKK